MSGPTIVSFDAADPALLARWERIVAENGLNPTLEPGWMQVAHRAIGGGATALQVLRDDNGSATRGIIPFFTSRTRMLGLPMRVLELGSNFISYHAELAAPGASAPLLRALLANAGSWDVLRASNIPVESETAEAIRTVARELGAPLQTIPGDRSPYLAITGTWDEFIATKNKKFRYKVRKRQEEIRNDPTFRLVWLTSEVDAEVLLKGILAIEERSWKAAAGMDIPSHRAEIEYHRQLLPYLARNGMLLANLLFKDDRPIAYSLCCSSRGWVGHLKTSFDDDFAAVSPGAFVIDVSLEKAFEIGAREFDFLGHDAPHKLAWSPTVRAHADYFLYAPKLKSRAVAALKASKERLRKLRNTPREQHSTRNE